MAAIDAFTGWEHRFSTTTSGGGLVIWDAKHARSGRGYIAYRNATAAAHPTGDSFYNNLVMSGASGIAAAGRGRIRKRYFVRAPYALPSTAIALCNTGGPATFDNWGVVLYANGTLKCYINNTSTPNEGSASTKALSAGWDQWLEVEETITIQKNAASPPGANNDSVTISATLRFADGTVETITHTRSTLQLGTLGLGININETRICGKCRDTAYNGTTVSFELHFDDWVVRINTDVAGGDADTPLLPTTSKRVALCMPTGQGALAQWTGDWWGAAKTAAQSTADLQQQAASAGLQTSFTHESLTTIAPNATTCDGINLYYHGAGGGTFTPKLGSGGVFPDANGTVFTNPSTLANPIQLPFRAESLNGAMAAATFDALEWGTQSVHATLNRLFGLLAEVLHDGDARPLELDDNIGFHLQFIEWTGDGTTRRLIAGVGFRSQFVQGWPIGTNGTSPPWFKLPDMPPGWAMQPNGAELGDFVYSITSDGFYVGSRANVTGVRYLALCVRDDGNGAGGRIFGSGAYFNASRTVTFDFEADYQPDFMFALRGRATSGVFFKHRLMGTDSYRADSGAADAAQGIISINTNGFTTGTNATLGWSVDQTWWWGFKSTAQVENAIVTAKVAGQAANLVVSMGDGNAPYAAFIKGTGGTQMYGRFDEPEFSGMNCIDFDGGAVNVAQGIIALDAVGGTFTVQGNAVHLDDAPVVDLFYFAFVLTIEVLPPTEVDFPIEYAIAGTAIPLWWLELYFDEGQMNVSTAHLEDPPDYFGGLKEALVLEMSGLPRRLSDIYGNPVTSGFRVVVSDADGRFRAKEANGDIFLHRIGIARGADDLDRRAELVARVFGIGEIEDYGALPDRKYFFAFKDYFAMLSGPGEKERNIPKRLRTRAEYASLPSRFENTTGQWIFGEMVDAGSYASPPVLNGSSARGSFFVPEIPANLTQYKDFPRSLWFMGWGNATGPAPPTGVVIAVNPGGTINLGQAPDNTLYVMVVSVSAAGVEGDPHIFDVRNLTPVVIMADGSKIDVSWAAAAGAAKYRVFLDSDFFNIHASPPNAQYIETAGTAVTFTAIPPFGVEATTDNITPGAVIPIWSRSRFYIVAARVAAGVTGVSQIAWSKSYPYLRPAMIEWNAVAGAIEYFVYGEDTAEGVAQNRWSLKWTTTNTYFIDDFSDSAAQSHSGPVGAVGAVKLDPVGLRYAADGSLWYEFEAAMHACKEIVDVFLDGVRVPSSVVGTHALIPGRAGYSTFFPGDAGAVQYRDSNGQRRTCVYGRGEIADQVFKGERQLTANIKGVESTGDGTGTLLTDIFDIYKYVMKNLVVGNQETLAAPTSPNWADSDVWTDAVPVIDEASFDRCKIYAATLVTGGFTGAFVLGADNERISVRELIKRLNLSAGCYSGWNRKMEFFVVMLDESTDLATTLQMTQTTEIVAGTFEAPNRAGNLENNIHYAALYDHVRKIWMLDNQEMPDALSINAHREERASQKIEYYCTRNLIQIAVLNARRLRLTRVPLRETNFTVTLPGASVELGDIERVTHDDGIGLTGYVDNPVFVVGHELKLTDFTTRLLHWDVKRALQGAAALTYRENRMLVNVGGSKEVSMKSDALTQEINSAVTFEIDWTLYAGWTFDLIAEVMTKNAATSIQPQVKEWPSGTIVATGSVSTSILEDYSHASQYQTVAIPSSVGVKKYRAYGVRNNLDNDTFMLAQLKGRAPA